MIHMQFNPVRCASSVPAPGARQVLFYTSIGGHCRLVVGGHCHAFCTSVFQVMQKGCQGLYAA